MLDLKLADHGRHREMIRTVQWALIRGQRLTGTYASPYEAKPRRLDLAPYRLCLVKQAWYLIARPEGSEQPRTYRVTRFKSLRPTDVAAEVPEDFDLKAYFGDAWGVYRGDRPYDVELHFAPAAATLVTETTWHHTQQARRHRDGGVTLTFRVDGLSEVARWVLGWSGWVTVVKPAELRRSSSRNSAGRSGSTKPDRPDHPSDNDDDRIPHLPRNAALDDRASALTSGIDTDEGRRGGASSSL